MKAYEEEIRVRLAQGGDYPILIGHGNLPFLGEVLRESGTQGDVFVVSDRKVWELHGARFAEVLEAAGYAVLDTFLIDPGEASKSLDNWRGALDRLVRLEDGAVRRMFLANFGGGVVGDLGGFVAAAYRRGIPFLQVPTTLLAQVDSSVGGKTAVNHPGGKNLIGAFYQPFSVFMDLQLLETLPPAEFRAGLAEVVKYGFIWDEPFLSYLEENMPSILALDRACLTHIVKRSCEVKAEVVGLDEREAKGVRTLLNFGHTFGHALEAATDYRVFLHGEAVGLGMLCAAWMSLELGMIRSEDYQRTRGDHGGRGSGYAGAWCGSGPGVGRHEARQEVHSWPQQVCISRSHGQGVRGRECGSGPPARGPGGTPGLSSS